VSYRRRKESEKKKRKINVEILELEQLSQWGVWQWFFDSHAAHHTKAQINAVTMT
jgi:hypothetical protein